LFPTRRHKTTCFWSQECLTGADIVVQVGDEVTKDEPITTNPNVGGFGQAPVVTLRLKPRREKLVECQSWLLIKTNKTIKTKVVLRPVVCTY
jgi:hypothetical protein